MTEQTTAQPILPGASFYAKAVFDYDAVEASELSIKAGDFLTIEEVNSSGWALARKDDKAGWIPADYVEKVESGSSSSSNSSSNGLAHVQEAMAKVHMANNSGEDRICGYCHESIKSAFVVAKDQSFHPNHFKCTTCHSELGGRPYLEKDGAFYCEDDYYAAFNPRCGACAEIIKGSYIQAMDRAYHPEHFVCSVCHKPFDNAQYRRHDDKPYCDQHFLELIAPKCAKCSKPIAAAVFEAIGQKFHLECFVCEADGAVIGEGKPFHLDDNKRVYCPQHYEELFLEKCTACKKPIKGQYIKVMNHNLHQECWKCTDCHVALQPSNAGQANGNFYCRTCLSKSGPSSSAPSSFAASNSSNSSNSNGATAAAASSEARVQEQLALAKKRQEEKQKEEAAAAAAAAQRNFSDPKTKKYAYDQLKNKPADVDPTKKDEYLSDAEFEKLFKQKREMFSKLPKWKRDDEKKKLGLF